MGNYYEGNLEFFFKDIPKDMMDLIIMREGYESIEKCREKYPAVNWLQHERANSPSFHLEELTTDKAKEEGIKYYLCINFCHKGYRLGFDLGDAIVNYFQPYNYVGKYNKHGYIGKIEDEDDTYSREFWSDYSWLKSEQEKREYLCNDCPHSTQWKSSLCKRYEICKRAYDLGVRKESMGKFGLTKERYNQLMDLYNNDEEEVSLVIENWTVEVVNKGYDIFGFDGTGMLEINKIDELQVFENDEKAVEQAIKDGIKIIPVEELPENFDRKYLGWIDTEENRKQIEKYCKKL